MVTQNCYIITFSRKNDGWGAQPLFRQGLVRSGLSRQCDVRYFHDAFTLYVYIYIYYSSMIYINQHKYNCVYVCIIYTYTYLYVMYERNVM